MVKKIDTITIDCHDFRRDNGMVRWKEFYIMPQDTIFDITIWHNIWHDIASGASLALARWLEAGEF